MTLCQKESLYFFAEMQSQSIELRTEQRKNGSHKSANRFFTHEPKRIRLIFYAFFFVIILITNSVARVITMPMGRTIIQLLMKPAIIYVTNEMAATVIA